MSPDVECWAGSKDDVTDAKFAVSVDLSVLMVMDEDADDSWCWRLLVDTIVELFEMSVVLDDDVNDGVYWVVEDAIDDWLPEFDCVLINVVETDITIALVVKEKVLL